MTKIAIIGTGRMGFAQARLARYFGDSIAFGIDSHSKAASDFSECFGCPVWDSLDAVWSDAWNELDVIWITTPDAEISLTASRLVPHYRGGLVLHCSGSLGVEAIKDHIDALAASCHPLIACPLVELSDAHCFAHYRGVLHAIEGDSEALRFVEAHLERLDAPSCRLGPGQKSSYHAAAVFASNYPLTLLEQSIELFVASGFERPQAKAAAWRLMQQSLESARKSEPMVALTGPAKRGDTDTIARHRLALASKPQVLALYEALLCATEAFLGTKR